MKRVLVTGANGHLGYNLSKELARRGYDVRVSVRDKSDPSKTRHLSGLGVEIVEADITQADSLRPALRERDGLFQVAAVYDTTSSDAEETVKEPTILGALNVLEAARQEKVSKIVFTSSCVAVGTVEPGQGPLDEDDWNREAFQAYSQAKTEAEERA